ncbi:ABC transporter substrate-binding protein [Streptomyces iranensis]|uniref:ABC transporter substrate-binding protein n=1 Tax=Streptomyces iranensis TaxID=576784 RepID=UPI0039B7367A
MKVPKLVRDPGPAQTALDLGISRRQAMSLAITALGGTALAACSPGSASSSHVTLNMWGFADLSKPLVRQYERAHPGVTIQTKISDYDASHQTLLTALASGNGPSIAQIAIDYMGEFVAHAPAFTDLRKFGASSLKSKYLGWRWNGGVAPGGSIVGIPTDVGGMAIAYRTDLFKKAGLPTDPAAVGALWPTWEDYINVGKKYVAATGKKFIDSGKAVFRAESNQGGLKYMDARGKPIHDTNPRIRKSWHDGVAAIDARLSANVATFTPQWDAAVANGTVATLIVPAWMLTQIEQQAPRTKGKWNIAVLPGKIGNDGGSFLAIPKNAPHAKEAYDFIKWLEAPTQQLALFKENNTFPTIPALYTDPAVTHLTNPFFSNAPVGKIYVESVQGMRPHPIGAKDRIIENQFENGLGRVDQGSQSGASSWTQVMSDVKRELQG